MGHLSRAKVQEHAITRLRQRYGIEASQADLDAICGQIARGEVKPALVEGSQYDGSKSRAWLVVATLHGKKVGLVYGRGRHMIITAAPPTGDGGFKAGLFGPIFREPSSTQSAA